MEIDIGSNLENEENSLSVWNSVACQIYGEECDAVAVVVVIVVATSESNRE